MAISTLKIIIPKIFFELVLLSIPNRFGC